MRRAKGSVAFQQKISFHFFVSSNQPVGSFGWVLMKWYFRFSQPVWVLLIFKLALKIRGGDWIFPLVSEKFSNLIRKFLSHTQIVDQSKWDYMSNRATWLLWFSNESSTNQFPNTKIGCRLDCKSWDVDDFCDGHGPNYDVIQISI